MGHNWSRDRAADHIEKKIGQVETVTVVDYKRHRFLRCDKAVAHQSGGDRVGRFRAVREGRGGLRVFATRLEDRRARTLARRAQTWPSKVQDTPMLQPDLIKPPTTPEHPEHRSVALARQLNDPKATLFDIIHKRRTKDGRSIHRRLLMPSSVAMSPDLPARPSPKSLGASLKLQEVDERRPP